MAYETSNELLVWSQTNLQSSALKQYLLGFHRDGLSINSFNCFSFVSVSVSVSTNSTTVIITN